MHLFRPKIYDVELYKDSSVIFEEELIYHVYTNNSLKDFFRWKREEFKGIIKKNSFKIELAQSTNFFLSPICRIEGQFLKSKGRLTIGLKIELKIIFAMLILAFTVFMIFLFCNMDILYLIGRIEIITAIIFLISIQLILLMFYYQYETESKIIVDKFIEILKVKSIDKI